VSKKPDLVPKLLDRVQPRYRLPRPLKEGSLLEQGMMIALVRHLSQSEAERVLAAIKQAYPDWNELRVAQAQEIASFVATGDRRATRAEVESLFPVVRAARDYLQEIFQKNHGFDLEFLREDPAAGAKTFAAMPYLGLAGTSYLLWLANGKQVPSHPGLNRVLDRIGLVQKGAGGKKAGKDVLAPLVPAGRELEFVAAFGEVADRWCHASKPLCHECPIVDDCTFGKKAFQEWKVQQARLEAQRVREEARRAIFEKKEAERRAKEDARLAKKAAIDAAKAQKEKERLAKIEAKRKEVEAKAKAKADALAKRAAAEAANKAAAEAKRLAAEKKKAELGAKKQKEKERRAKIEAKRKEAEAKAKAKAEARRKEAEARAKAKAAKAKKKSSGKKR
jgi:endonuclease III